MHKHFFLFQLTLLLFSTTALGMDKDPQKIDISWSALHRAVGEKDTQQLQTLLEAGADPNAEMAGTGMYILRHAISRGNSECVRLLLKAGANPNAQDDERSTHLHTAIDRHTDTTVAQLLLTAGADPNISCSYLGTPLHHAARFKEPEHIKLLLKAHGVDPMAKDQHGKTPLHLSSFPHDCYGNFEDLLQKPEIKKDFLDKSTECMQLLLAAGADPNAQDDARSTPLHKATSQLLPYNVKSMSRLFIIVPTSAKLAQTLLQAGADPNIQNKYGETPLYNAAWDSKEECVRMLLLAGARTDILNGYGNTVVYHATKKINYLLEDDPDQRPIHPLETEYNELLDKAEECCSLLENPRPVFIDALRKEGSVLSALRKRELGK